MLRITRWICVALAVAGWLSAAAPAPGQGKNNPPRTVNDEAGLFSKEAIQAANREIAEMKSTYKKDVMIETREKGPRDDFRAWAMKQAERYGTEGVYVVITKEPAKFEVLVGKQTEKKMFTRENETHLIKLLGSELKKNRDQALREAVRYVHEAFRENSRTKTEGAQAVPAVPAPVPHEPAEVHKSSPFGGALCSGIGGFICLGLVVLVGVWVIIAIVRAFTRPAGGGPGYGGPGYGGPGYGGGYGGGGGGGFFSSLLGGMFGAAAGNWMYNSFLGGHSYSQPPSNPTTTSNPNPADANQPAAQEPTDANSGYNDAGGGDWGNDDKGGGGDAGGGDAGGGDAGGGDAGGGGDWGGGGGGDAGGGDWGGGGGGDWGGGGGGDFGGGGGGGDW